MLCSIPLKMAPPSWRHPKHARVWRVTSLTDADERARFASEEFVLLSFQLYVIIFYIYIYISISVSCRHKHRDLWVTRVVSIIHEARTLSLLSIDIKTDAYVLRFIDMINKCTIFHTSANFTQAQYIYKVVFLIKTTNICVFIDCFPLIKSCTLI